MKNRLNRLSITALLLALFSLTLLPNQTWAMCGDTIIDPGEACDDGNYLDPQTETIGVFRVFEDPAFIAGPGPTYLTSDGYILVANQQSVTRINTLNGAQEVFIPPTDGATYTFGIITGIVEAPDSSFFISDFDNDLVYHFDTDGNYLGENNSIASPNDILFHPDGRLLVVSGIPGAVMSLDPANFANPADIFADDAQVGPIGMAISQNGILYVSNAGSSNISNFLNLNDTTADPDGVFISSGPVGSEEELDFPTLIALRSILGEEDQLCVVDGNLDNIKCYRLSDGAFSGILLDSVALGGQPFDTPVGIEFDGNGNLWTTAFGSNRLYLYILNPLNSNTEPNACRIDCTEPICGDGVADDLFGEQCDDGNLEDGDGCDASCQIEIEPQGTANNTGSGCSLNPATSISVFPYAWMLMGLVWLGWKRVRR